MKTIHYGLMLGTAALAWGLAGPVAIMATPAWAQTSPTAAPTATPTAATDAMAGTIAENTATTTPGTPPATSSAASSATTPGTPAGAAADATPAPTSPFAGLTAFGQTLARHGLYLDLGYTEDVSAVVAGGAETGVMPIGHLTAGAVFDLNTIAGIPGASLHVTFEERSGHSVNAIAGSPIGLLQSDAGPFKSRLSEFFWQQGFDHDRVDVTFGRTSPTLDFAISDISCGFVGVLCAQPTSWYFNNGDVPYPSSAWGGRVNIAVTPRIYVRAGGYQHDSTATEWGNMGFNWNMEHSQGAFFPAEIGYQTSFKTAQYPGKYNAGFYVDTQSYQKADGEFGNRGAVWLQAQQTVWRPDPATTQSLTLFGGALIYNGNSPTWTQTYVGVYDRGPFLSRPRDTIGFIASLYTNNSAIQATHSTQAMFELNYGCSIIPGVTVKPFVQYVVDPAGYGASPDAREENAWLLGVQVAINATEMFQFPQFVPH